MSYRFISGETFDRFLRSLGLRNKVQEDLRSQEPQIHSSIYPLREQLDEELRTYVTDIVRKVLEEHEQEYHKSD